MCKSQLASFYHMPIQLPFQVEVFPQEEFHALARQILRIAFDVHNEFGRLLDEELYKRELAARCLAEGIRPAAREVRITVTHNGFRKDYFMDLLFANGVMTEAKTVECLTQAHHGQALNYLLLAGMRHGLLLNFRTPRVEHRFISSSLTPEQRREFTVDGSRWRSQDPEAAWLQEQMLKLMEDWGSFLEVTLYRDAIIHFLGGSNQGYNTAHVLSGNKILGPQNVMLLRHGVAFAITAVSANPQAQESHLTRLLAHTDLSTLHWINIQSNQLTFTSISNPRLP